MNLPDIYKFFSSLKDCCASEKECQRACDVWKVFKIKNLGEYHDFSLKTDVLLLCDGFEKFINVCLKDYGLDLCHYFSAPGLSWDAMLKMTDIQLEKINNIDIYLFLEKGMRSGVSYISNRYSKSDENTEITYSDASNLYGWAMIQDLSYGGSKSLSDKEINDFDLDSVAEYSPVGYVLEVDLKFCKKLHDSLSDYPLCPEKIEINYDMLSKYCKDIADWYDIKVAGVKKLVPNLGDKVEYVVHYKNLKYYFSLGMKLVKIHIILSFKQSDWLKKYVDFNTKKRQESPDEFNKGLYKLLNNCIYGKSIENQRKRMNVKLISDKKHIKNVLINQISYHKKYLIKILLQFIVQRPH